MTRLDALAGRAASGEPLVPDDVRRLFLETDLDRDALLGAAREIRDATTGPRVTFSRKVFIPLTQLCRDACGYCTFAHPPRPGEGAFMTIEEMLQIARAGAQAGCKEALFTLGDKPERKWRVARAELDELGYGTTIAYLAAA